VKRRGSYLLGTLILIALTVIVVLTVPHHNWLFTGRYSTSFVDIRARIRDVHLVQKNITIYGPVTTPQYFSYPPAALLLFFPFAWIKTAWAIRVWTFISLWAVAGAIHIARRVVGRPGQWWVSCAAAAVAVAVLPPLSILLADGQLGTLLLIALISDSLAVPARFRGYLTGLVTAIKIYPAIFVVVWLWRRQWADVARAVGAWAVVTGIAAVLWPSYTSTFISRLIDGSEVTRFTHFIHWRATSSSPYTVLFRWPFGNEAYAATVGSLACVAVVALALWASQRARRANWPLSEFVIILMASTLAAPVVWDHYFVWFALLPLVALEVGVRRPLGILVLAATVIAMLPWQLGRNESFSVTSFSVTTLGIFASRTALLAASLAVMIAVGLHRERAQHAVAPLS